MARDVFDVEVGLSISAENGARQAYILTGTAVPDGTSGKQSEAPIGSLYLRSGTGELYQKIANAGAPADYELNGAGSLSAGNWRNEKVRFATDDVLAAGVVNVLTLTDNDDMVYGDIAVGEYVIGDRDGTPLLFEVTAAAGTPNITIAAAGSALIDNDTFVVQQYLPDPTGQEGQAIVHFPLASAGGVKIGDINWEFATGINLSGAYSAVNGTISSADSVESAIEKLDGNQQDIQTSSGIAQGAVDYGTFTGAILPDSSVNKVLHQAMETAVEEIDANVNDLITLSGESENATVHAAFAAVGSFLLGASETTRSALQKLADYLYGVKVTQTVGITTATVVDSLPHATYGRVKWVVEVFETATPGNAEGVTVDVLTDGVTIDDTVFGKLNLTKISGLSITAAINGANIELSIAATASCTVNVRRITVV